MMVYFYINALSKKTKNISKNAFLQYHLTDIKGDIFLFNSVESNPYYLEPPFQITLSREEFEAVLERDCRVFSYDLAYILGIEDPSFNPPPEPVRQGFISHLLKHGIKTVKKHYSYVCCIDTFFKDKGLIDLLGADNLRAFYSKKLSDKVKEKEKAVNDLEEFLDKFTQTTNEVLSKL
jgi:hypothetical protein